MFCPRYIIPKAPKLVRAYPHRFFPSRQLPKTSSLFPPLATQRSLSTINPSFPSRRFQHTQSISTDTIEKTPELIRDALPICCPGCGAYAQTVDLTEPGYYGKVRKRKSSGKKRLAREGTDHKIAQASTSSAEGETAVDGSASGGVESKAPVPSGDALIENQSSSATEYLEAISNPSSQLCDRCHDLLHHNKAVPAPTPTIYSIRELLDESPHKDNHVYHILDAADFPMSLVPNIYDALSLQEQRSRNRRAGSEKYRHGRKLPKITFIITRSDLLAATKEQVDSKMEYMRKVLRDALGMDEAFRLGNVHMISAQRGWWTRKVKEEIRAEGGGVWVVGKANVGKSSFIEACFPKDSKNLEKIAELVKRRQEEGESMTRMQVPGYLDPDSLLPPAPREDLYPTLPIVSSLPGTTVSPIRIPFGRGKGEMIDLPGLDRGRLEDFVRDEHKRDLIMTKRGSPERYTIKPGQSLLLGGGLIRITPVNPDSVVMAACFLPIEAHVTRTEKAIEMQAQQRAYPGKNIVKDDIVDSISSAGVFDLKWDVTTSHLPTSIEKAVEDKGIPIPPLPYKVMSADIVIEGCGWVELTEQIRAKKMSTSADQEQQEENVPQMEVFSPNGQHVGSRQPIECWDFIAQKKAADKRKRPTRGRQNIGHKRRVVNSQPL